MKPFQRHQLKWKNCTACSLCEGRRNVVLFRGQIPCDVLMIGEAPGPSEDVIGSPSVGPAGHLLDEIIQQAMPIEVAFDELGEERHEPRFRVGFTNLVACIPIGEDGNKVKEPPDESIKACSDRLEELLLMCKPKLVVCVGKLPWKWLPKLFGSSQFVGDNMITITHPAALLRMDASQYGLAYRQCVVALADAFGELE